MISIHAAILILVISIITRSYGIPTECPINEHRVHCVNPCPTPTCPNPIPANCTFLVCSEGCECNEGYVRTKKPDGPCIPIDRCKNCLRPGFEFRECGLLCSTTCRGVLSHKFCPLICEPGCYCAGGKVLDEKTNSCVDKSKCGTKIDD